MKPCFVVMHSYYLGVEPYPVGVWFDQTKAQEYCDEQHRLQDICRTFIEKQRQLPAIPRAVFPKPEPKKDKTLLNKFKELEAINPKNAETQTARIEWLKYINEFNATHKTWENEQAVFHDIHQKEHDLFVRNQFVFIVNASSFMTEDLAIKILNLYDRGYQYWDESSKLEVKETVCNV